MAALFAGFPDTVPVRTVNRQCSSGLQAVADVAASIKAGYYKIGIGAGLESMTVNPMAWEGSVNPKVEMNQKAQDCLLPMGITSENVAERFGVNRKEQDDVAVIAIPAAVSAAGLEVDDIDLFEINEAFASQFTYCARKLELDEEKINVNGGALAIGHPLGATGTGMGAAAVLERGDYVCPLTNAKHV
ncbi:unnamed protein product [Closterium sp. NIES-65]|nr:unnamed protein product [Closterium sp. NIES-65]